MKTDMTPAERSFREQTIRRAVTTCKHFNGIQHDSCNAGVKYQAYQDNPNQRIPCIPPGKDKRESWKCELFCVMTQEEAEQEANDWERVYKMAVTARSAAKDDAKAKGLVKGSGGRSNLKCPVCADGILHYSVASLNGHMHAKCTTDGCASWME